MKYSVLMTLMYRARVVCHQESLPREPNFLRTTVKENGYSGALCPPCREEPTSVAFLLFVECINRVLTRDTSKTVGLPHRKVASFLRSVKDDLGLKTAGFYGTPTNMVRPPFVKPDVPLRPGSRSSTGTSGCTILTN
jgi:hypothetical protein